MNKKVLEFAEKHPEIDVVEITYRFNGYPLKRKGFDFVNAANNSIVASFEPLASTRGGWKVICRYKGSDENTVAHPKNITKNFLESIDLEYESFMRIYKQQL